MKILALILLFSAMLSAGVTAQSTVLQSDDITEDSVPKKKVLVVPFHQLRYYFSDCDKQVGAASKMNPRDLRQAYQLSFDYSAEASMEKRYAPINLAQMKDSVDEATLKAFYENVGYAYETPLRAPSKRQESILKKLSGNVKQLGAGKQPPTLNDMESYVMVDDEDKQYMKLLWKNGDFLSRLNEMYHPDYIVTINQFEIRTDFQQCIDRELGKFARQMKVHFNVFRPDGKMIYGDVVTAKYNSTNDNFNKIVEDNFGLLSDYVTQMIPGRN
jgi:hypothetical protein